MRVALRWSSWIGIFLAASVTAWAQTAWAQTAFAQGETYPSRAITVVVPFPAGGLTDVPMRLAASLLQDKIGQPVVIENRTGASGTIGAAYVARATPDGYTLHANSIGDAQNIHHMPLPYHPVDDFAMIGWIVDGPPLILAIDAKLPIRTVAELIADAKAHPGKYSFATSGLASSPNAAVMQFNVAAGIEIQAVPYRGSGEAATAVATSAIQGTFTYFSQGKALVDTGKLRALAIAGPRRMEAWPEVPTLPELGFKIDTRGFVGLGAPARTPKPIVAYLNKHLAEVLQTDRFKKPMAELGMAPPPAADNTPEKFDKFIRDEIARQGLLAELTGQKIAPPKQ
jgi:tripartite-type tricarboxylate transporter receptor subunit TctC